MTAKRRKLRVSPSGLGLVSWAPGETNGTRPPCTTVGPAERGAWTSDDPDARAMARLGCKACPIQATCLRMAMDSKVKVGVFGGFNLSAAVERKLAGQWLAAQERAS